MNIYTNAFRCSTKNDGDELVIQFLQTSPDFDADGNVSNVSTEIVSSLVMGTDMARQLANTFAMLSKDTDNS